MPTDIQKSRKKSLLISALGVVVLLLIAGRLSGSFDTFNKDHLIKSTFGMDLTPYVERGKSSYSDGCLQFYGIDETHPLYMRYFPSPPSRTFGVSFLHESFDKDNDIGYAEVGKSFDGYVPVVLYIPRLKRLVFGYSNGMGG